MPFFSIIIPTFNSSEDIAKCLRSVLCQTFDDFEILVMDGNSTDITAEVIKQFNDKRINFFSELDCGIYDAMNKGIMKSSASWLYFLGSDDILIDSFVLSDVHSQISENNIDVLYGKVRLKYSDFEYNGLFTYDKMLENNICHQAIFYNIAVFRRFGLYDLKYKVLADYYFNIKWFFSKKITSIYYDRLIAVYNEKGFSSVNKDNVFRSNFSKTMFWKGYGKYSTIKLKELAYETSIFCRDNNQRLEYYLYQLFYYFLRVVNIVERLKLKLIKRKC